MMRLTRLGMCAALATLVASPSFAYVQQRSYSAPVQQRSYTPAPQQRTYSPPVQRQAPTYRPQQNVVRPQTKTAPQYSGRPQQTVRTPQTTQTQTTKGQYTTQPVNKQGFVSNPSTQKQLAPVTKQPIATPVAAGKSLKAINGTGQVALKGQNYTVWKGAHRVRWGGGWRTFGALSVLSAVVISGYEYYPYAYLSAPADTCTGVTEDGCALRWEDVPTEEGGVASQCVAYCPWQ